MMQEIFFNCPDYNDEENKKRNKKAKVFVESKIKLGECGTQIKDYFLIDHSFWLKPKSQKKEEE